MAIKLKFTRNDSGTPWGFRVTGGANFEIPLTTIKVVEDSIARENGLEIGDVIVKINDIDITALTHAQAHDRIIECENELNLTIVRNDISDALRSIIAEEESMLREAEDIANESVEINQEVENILEGSVPIDYPEKTIEDLIKDTANKQLEDDHDLNLTDEEIHSIIDPEIVTRKAKIEAKPIAPIGPPAKSKLEPPQVLKPANHLKDNKLSKEMLVTQETVKYMQSHVIQEINNNLREGLTDGERRWSTFLQRPQRAIPLSKPQFQIQKSTYKVKIRTKKDLEAERAAKQAELEAEALRQEKLAEQEAAEEAKQKEEDENAIDDEISSDSSFTFSDSDNLTEDTITFTPSGTEPTISFTETLNSLEEKLEQVKQQLQVYNVELVPDALQKMLTKIASQLERIVKVVKPQAQNAIQNGDGNATDDEVNYNDFSDDERSSISSLDSRISSPTPSTPSCEGTEPTLTFSSYSIMSDPPSASTPEGTEPSLTFSDEHADVAECDRTECDVTEMQEYQEDTEDNLAKTVAEKTNKKEKVEHWNRIWPWTHFTQPIYRESNCCMVPSTVTATKKINFLKYQPPPKSMDHLKNSEVYKMVHNLGPDSESGIFSRPEKVLAGQDYQSHASPVPQQF